MIAFHSLMCVTCLPPCSTTVTAILLFGEIIPQAVCKRYGLQARRPALHGFKRCTYVACPLKAACCDRMPSSWCLSLIRPPDMLCCAMYAALCCACCAGGRLPCLAGPRPDDHNWSHHLAHW